MMSGKYSCKDWGMLLIRIAVAFVFIQHGVQKLTNMSQTVAFFGMLGIPAALAWITALGEVLAGLLVLLGAWTRWAGYFVAIVMLVAILTAKRKMGIFSWDLELSMMFVALGLSCTGPGAIALHAGCGCCSGTCAMGKNCKGSCCKEESDNTHGGCCQK